MTRVKKKKNLHSAERSLFERDSVDADIFCLLGHCPETTLFFLFSSRLFSRISLSISVLGEADAAGLHMTPSIRSGSVSGFILKKQPSNYYSYFLVKTYIVNTH